MKRKPYALRVLQGTARPDRDYGEPDLPLATDTSPPHWLLDAEAVAEWNRVTALLTPAGVLTPGDLTLLGHLCNMHARAVSLWASGVAPKAADLTQLRQVYSDFGLTPASRSKVGGTKPPAASNAFEALKSG